MNVNEQKQGAKEFAEFWKNKGYEKGQSQTFWLQLLNQVLGIKRPEEFIEFEDQVHIDKNTGFIDGYIPTTKVLIEQKSIDKDLRKAHQENDKAVMEAYGFDWKKMTESDCVAELMKMYEKLMNGDK